MQTKLSELTPSVVDALYGLDRAEPVEEPIFIFMVGAPGSGKSSGHALLPEGNYVTINIDTLLESLLPFRAASAMAHHYKQWPTTHDLVHFAAIGAYSTRKENLGLFKWYDENHAALMREDPIATRGFNRIRRQFPPLDQTSETLVEINDAALDRAIARRVNIVYETTLSLTKEGRVTKVDRLMRILKKTPYRVAFYHITGSVDDITQRIRSRQEHQMSQDSPFHRYISTRPEKVAKYIQTVAAAFAALTKQYKKATFVEIANPIDPMRLPAENRRASTRRRIVSAYAGSNRRPNSELGSSYRVSTPSSQRTTRKSPRN